MKSKAWPASLAVREGLANALAGRWTAVLVLISVAWITGLAGLGNALDVSRLADAERAWLDSGGHVLVAQAGLDETAGIDVARCEQLRSLPGVAGAYAVLPTGRGLSVPGSRASEVLVSPGAFTFYGLTEPASPSVLATASTLTGPGLGHEDQVVFLGTGGRVTVHRVDSAAVPADLVGTWLVPNLTGGTAQRCLVRAEAGYLDGLRPYLESHLASGHGSAVVVSLAPQGRDFTADYASRPLAWASCAAAIVLGALWAIISWARREQMAIYTSFGAGPRARLLLQAAQWAALSVPGACWGWGTAMVFAVAFGARPGIALTQVSAHVFVGWAGASLLVVLIALIPVGSLLDALKDRP